MVKTSVQALLDSLSPEMITEMRGWISDCVWDDLDEFDELTDAQIVRGVQRHYFDGVAGFLADAAA